MVKQTMRLWTASNVANNDFKQIISQRVRTVVDDRWRILNEYKRNANIVRQKGIGDGFVKRLLQKLEVSRHLYDD